MNFYNYISSLFKTFKRDEIVDAALSTRKSMMEHSIPAYSAAVQAWQGVSFVSKEAKDIEKQYKLEVSMPGKQNMFTSIDLALKNSLDVLELVIQKGKVLYQENEATAGITFQKATILRIISISDFANKYSMDLLNYIYSCEARSTGGPQDDKVSKAEEDAIIKQFSDFCTAINVLKVDMSSLTKALNDLPDAVVSEITEKTFIATMGTKKLDALNTRNFSVRKNPFYTFGLVTAEKQEKKYKAKKEMLELIQLRLMQLQKLRDKTQDASLDKEIEYYQGRVTGLNHDIEKMNKDYGL